MKTSIQALELARQGKYDEGYELAKLDEGFNPDATKEQFIKWANLAIANEAAERKINEYCRTHYIDWRSDDGDHG